MIIGVIGAMTQETDWLVEQLQNANTQTVNHLTFQVGTLGEHQVVVAQSGIGKVNASIATTVLITQFHVDYVINTGSAGALDSQLSVGDIVVGSKLAYHDVDATAFGYEIGQLPQMPLYYTSDERLISSVQKVVRDTDQVVKTGLILSADMFVSGQEMRQRIKKQFKNALCTEMEGAAIAQTCAVFKVPFIIIRSISDSADESASVSFDEFIEVAGKKSAQLVKKTIEELV